MFHPANEPKSLLCSWQGLDSDCCSKFIISKTVSQHCCKLLTLSLHICSVEHNLHFQSQAALLRTSSQKPRQLISKPHSLAIAAPHLGELLWREPVGLLELDSRKVVFAAQGLRGCVLSSWFHVQTPQSLTDGHGKEG